MDLTSPHAFWLLKNGIGEVPPSLPGDAGCDVLILGAGITGALIADAMTAAGLSVLVIDRRHPGHGSTSASTALLQYEIDRHLADLIETIGRPRAEAAYRACLDGVEAVARLAEELGAEHLQFKRRPSLYLASRRRHVRGLQKEAEARRDAGLPCEFLNGKEVRNLGFDAPAALWSSAAAEVDPWRLAQALLARSAGRDFALYGRTEALGVIARKGVLEVATNRGRIRTKHLIVATGYEADRFLPEKVSRLHSTYALVTEPVASFSGWPERCLIWESARPYLYLRTTADDRVLVGGMDRRFRNPALRDALVPKTAARLFAQARKMFPRIPMKPAYAWAGTFGETEDGLAYIGAHPKADPRIHFALGFGGNGITYSALAAEILAAKVVGKDHPYAETFSFDR
ncbi:MAG TPA: FAD-dependent oxidoreductase [Thermoanaerobaculia bacterium]|nr:FAD-dependent oxidoreductase [Thermoanaerobaculia bacterium]